MRKTMGKPPMYKTVGEIEGKIEKYFEECKGHPLVDDAGNPMVTKFGQPIFIDVHPLTVTGLALALVANIIGSIPIFPIIRLKLCCLFTSGL